ncbi:transposable element Tcb1 transposase [Trichonephila clavipes]|nr:transposable element Tcb1 transposase [Trichonephila clavipes]
MFEKASVLSDCLTVSSEESVTADDDNVCTAPIMADKDILEFVKSSKNIIDADSDDENEMNMQLLCSRIIRNEQHHEKYAQLFRCTVQSVMFRKKQLSAFDQISEFDRGRTSEIVHYLSAEWSDRKTSILLGLPLTQNHRRLSRQWCYEIRMWVAEWNEVVFTDESRICLQHNDGRIRVWRHRGERMLNSYVMHRHTGPVPGIMGLATAIFQLDNARLHVVRIVQRFFVNSQIELLIWTARSPDLSTTENMWSMVAQRLTQITP